MSTTQTGVPIIDCKVCGRKHPENRTHCTECNRPSLFINPATGICIHCTQEAA